MMHGHEKSDSAIVAVKPTSRCARVGVGPCRMVRMVVKNGTLSGEMRTGTNLLTVTTTQDIARVRSTYSLTCGEPVVRLRLRAACRRWWNWLIADPSCECFENEP
jgi:hypothetical protein